MTAAPSGRLAVDPHAVLALAAAAELGLEAARTQTGSSLWLLASAAVGLAALLLAWREQDQLRLLPLVAIALAFHLLWIWTHETLGAVGDIDPNYVYPVYGNEFLSGHYPEAEYPVGAVLLFALHALLGGDSAETPNRLLMVPFQLVCVLAIWALRTPHSRWLAAVIAIWPLNTFYWEYRFDLVPAALLVLGLLLAYRERWGWSGLALGVGTLVKWSPALAFAVLAVWLLAGRRWRDCRFLALGFVTTGVLANVPFLLWNAHNVMAAYRNQSARGITNESIWLFPLRLFGLAGDTEQEWAEVGAPPAANSVAVAVQAAALVAVLWLAVRVRNRLEPALALAAAAPIVFFVTNKIFSPQFLVVLVAGWAFAASLVTRRRTEQLAYGLLLMVAALANAFVYPYDLPGAVVSWQAFSAVLFAAAVTLTVLLVRAAVDTRPFPEAVRRRRAGPAVALPRWIGWSTASVVAIFFAAAAFVACALPYRLADSLALGAWSRTMAEVGAFQLDAVDVQLHRPLFYALQGSLWQSVGYHEWLGRILGVALAVGLALCVWQLAGLLTRPDARGFAIGVLLASSVFAAGVAAGTADVPVAAATAATALALWSPRVGSMRVYLVAVAAAATVLAKPTGLLAVAGLALATVVLADRVRPVEGLFGLVAGTAAALAYDALEARRLGESLGAFLSAGDADYWNAGDSWVDATVRGEWLGAGVRLVVLFGLVYALARALAGAPRAALAIAGPVAVVASLVGPVVADGAVPYPFDRVGPGVFAYLLLCASLLLAPRAGATDPVDRRVYVALLLWAAPAALVWVAAGASEVRLLAVTWPALALLAAAAVAAATAGLNRLAPAAALMPIAGLALLVAANVVAIDGLGRDGWRRLLEHGPSAWSDDYAYGGLASTLALARAHVAPGDRIVTNDPRLAYFFPGRVDLLVAGRCSELEGARYFALGLEGEGRRSVVETRAVAQPLAWLQCRRPRLQPVAEAAGVQAAYVVGAATAQQADPAACGVTSYPGEMHDAVFADAVDYATARSVARRASRVFQHVRIERTGCATFRVVVTGLPSSTAGQTDFRHEAEVTGFPVSFVPAVRYPEVPGDIRPPPD